MDDIESEWAYEKDPFDYIHARYLTSSIRDYGKVIKQCYRSVKPGGWVEFQDWDAFPFSEDDSLNDTGFLRYYKEVYGSFEEAGYEVRPGTKLEAWFKDAGFVNIHVEKFVIPYGVWPKDPYYVCFPHFASNNNNILISFDRKLSAPGCKPRPNRTASRAQPWLF